MEEYANEVLVEQTPLIIGDAEGEQITPEPNGIKEGTKEWTLFEITIKRNSYLSFTDKFVLPDYPITDEKREIIKNYRQYLRDLININREAILNGENIEFLPIPIL